MLPDLAVCPPPQVTAVLASDADLVRAGLNRLRTSVGSPKISNIWYYGFQEEKVHSQRYSCIDDGDPYSVYVPHEVFEGLKYPSQIAVGVAIYS